MSELCQQCAVVRVAYIGARFCGAACTAVSEMPGGEMAGLRCRLASSDLERIRLRDALRSLFDRFMCIAEDDDDRAFALERLNVMGQR